MTPPGGARRPLSWPSCRPSLASPQHPLPVYIVGGNEPFLIDECADALLSLGEAPDPHSRMEITFGEAPINEVLDYLRQMDFFGSKRGVIIQNAARALTGPNLKAILDYLQAPDETSTLVLVVPEIYKRLRAKKPNPLISGLLERGGIIAAWAPWDNSKLIRWIRERARALGFAVDAEAAAVMVEAVGTGLAELNSELEKMASSGVRVIDAGKAAEMVGRYRDLSAFDYANAVLAEDLERALSVLPVASDRGRKVNKVISALVFRLGEVSAKSRGKGRRNFRPGEADLMKRAVVRWGRERRREAHLRILDIDLDLKSGGGSSAGSRARATAALAKMEAFTAEILHR